MAKQTKEQKENRIFDKTAASFIAILSNLKKTPKKEAVDDWLKLIYDMYSLPVPKLIIYARSPDEAIAIATAAMKKDGEDAGFPVNTAFSGIYSVAWVAHYTAIKNAGIDDLGEFAAPVSVLENFARNAWDGVLLDNLAIVVKHPSIINTDQDGQLHCATGPAISWGDGICDYYWHGTPVSEKVVMRAAEISKNELLSEKNTEVRRAMFEIIGWDVVAGLLDANCIDTWTDNATGLAYSLFEIGTNFPKLLKKQSPILKTGYQPVYFEPVHEELNTAQAARKWQAVRRMSPSQCETDPSLGFSQEA